MNEEISILKIGTCPSLSKRSKLTYHVGIKDQEIHLRLVENTAGGLFGKEWVPLEMVTLALSEPVTSRSVQDLFKGKSVNTGGFILAVLLKEGLVRREGQGYHKCDPSVFRTTIQELIDSGVSLDDTKPPPPNTAKIVKAKKLGPMNDERGACR